LRTPTINDDLEEKNPVHPVILSKKKTYKYKLTVADIVGHTGQHEPLTNVHSSNCIQAAKGLACNVWLRV
jgi:hypothetical protein